MDLYNPVIHKDHKKEKQLPLYIESYPLEQKDHDKQEEKEEQRVIIIELF